MEMICVLVIAFRDVYAEDGERTVGTTRRAERSVGTCRPCLRAG